MSEAQVILHGMIQRLIGPGKEVLELLGDASPKLHGLGNQKCNVVSVGRAPMYRGLVVSGPALRSCDLDDPGWPETLGDCQFDVAVALDTLGTLKDPEGLLRVVSVRLRPGGYLIASFPNVAHGSNRLALLRGTFPGCEGAASLRSFTLQSAVELLEKAGYVVGRIDRQEADFLTAGLPEAIRETLDAAPDVRVARFLITAFPVAGSESTWWQQRLRQLVEEKEELVRREREMRNRVVEAQNELCRKDEALLQTLRELAIQRSVREDLEARLNRIWSTWPFRTIHFVRRGCRFLMRKLRDR